MNLTYRAATYFWVAVFAILTCILFFLTPSQQSHLEIDSSGYERIGVHFSQTLELIDPLHPAYMPVQTFAYPLFLGLIYLFLGHSYNWVVLIQLLLSIACGLMLCNVTNRILGPRASLVALALWSVNLGFLVYVQFLMTEILLVTCLVAFLERFFAYLQTRKTSTLAVAGFALGCSVIVKPAALFFIAPLSVLLLFFLSGPFMRRISMIFVLQLSFFAPVAAYMASNKVRYGYFRIAPMANAIIYRYFVPRVKAHLENKSFEQVVAETQWNQNEDLLDDSCWDSSREFLQQTIRDNPFVLARVWLLGVSKTVLGLFSTQLKVLLDPSVRGGECSFFSMSGASVVTRAYQYITFGDVRWISLVAFLEALWMMVRYFFVVIALVFLFRQKKYFLVSFCVTYLGYFTLVTGHEGSCRYRMLIEPLLIVLIAIGIDTLLKNYGMLRKYL